jgi:hypothetical protein
MTVSCFVFLIHCCWGCFVVVAINDVLGSASFFFKRDTEDARIEIHSPGEHKHYAALTA